MLELIATLAVAAVVMSVGVPGFLNLIQDNRVTAYTNDLVSALNLGRSEAMRRNTSVLVCSSVDGASCAANMHWGTGWVVRTEAGELIRSWPALAGAEVLSTNHSEVQFRPRGSAAALATLQVRPPNCTGRLARNVAVSRAGRVSIARTDC